MAICGLSLAFWIRISLSSALQLVHEPGNGDEAPEDGERSAFAQEASGTEGSSVHG